MHKVIGVLSGKGGVGKTTVVSNLGTTLTLDFGMNTLIIDNSVAFSHLSLHLGLYDGFKLNLKDIISRKMSVSYAIQTHPAIRVKILSAPLDGMISSSKLNSVVRGLKKGYDIIIVDCPPGFGRDVLAAMSSIEKALIVTTPEIPDISDALKVVYLLQKLNKGIIGVVVNRVKNEKYELSIDEIRSLFKVPIISVIKEDPKVPESIAKGIPIVLCDKNSKTASQLKKLASHVLGKRYVRPGIFERIKSFLGFRKKFKEFYVEEERIYEEKLKTEGLQKELKGEMLKKLSGKK